MLRTLAKSCLIGAAAALSLENTVADDNEVVAWDPETGKLAEMEVESKEEVEEMMLAETETAVGQDWIEMTEANWEKEITNETLPVMIAFWAPWCPPCRAMSPAWAEAATEMKGKVKFVKVQVSEQRALSGRFGIRGIPTLKYWKAGNKKGDSDAAKYPSGRSKDAFVKFAKTLIPADDCGVPPCTDCDMKDPNIAKLKAELGRKTWWSTWMGVKWQWISRKRYGNTDYFVESCKNTKPKTQKVTFTFDTANYDLISPKSTGGKYCWILEPGQIITNYAKYKKLGGRFSWSIYKFTTEDCEGCRGGPCDGTCSGGNCTGGNCTGGNCTGGNCTGGNCCPGGNCA